MMKKKYYSVIFIVCLIVFSLQVKAYDYLILYDFDYYNPLAVAFKWKVKVKTLPLKNQIIKIRYIINNDQNGKMIFSRTRTIMGGAKEFYVYLFISNLAAGSGNPIIRMEHLPATKGIVSIYKFPEKSKNTSVLFTGANKIEGVMQNKVILLKTQLLKSSFLKVNKTEFKRSFFAPDNSLKRICNLNITFAVQFEIVEIDNVPKKNIVAKQTVKRGRNIK